MLISRPNRLHTFIQYVTFIFEHIYIYVFAHVHCNPQPKILKFCPFNVILTCVCLGVEGWEHKFFPIDAFEMFSSNVLFWMFLGFAWMFGGMCLKGWL